MTRTKALAKHLGCSVDDIEPSGYDEDVYEAEGKEFLVLTDELADQRTADYIKDSVWAFRPGFLQEHLPDGIGLDTIKIIQEKCEDANPAILGMIKDVDRFIDDAISADGRGHFLSSYDGHEYEEDEYFIYRVN